MTAAPGFTFVDLFAGIGGFHAALTAMGGTCVFASEIDRHAAAVYERNWSMDPLCDIVDATTDRMDVPEHDVLAAGFPCQPFSKSGFQRGMDEARGTLFWNILRVLEERRPAVVLLENVRNIAGPRHRHEWEVIIASLRELGYQVSSQPAVFSPHLLPPERGGRPQIRERVFIVATLAGSEAAKIDPLPVVTRGPVDSWDPQSWSLEQHLPLTAESEVDGRERYALNGDEVEWINAWDDFVATLRRDGVRQLPGFPVWADHFTPLDHLRIPVGTPDWKKNFLHKNALLYTTHRQAIDEWLSRWNGLAHFPASRRKLEWQAKDAPSLWETVMHFRPSGIRAKQPTYTPALVAITQTSILGAHKRRLTPREAARLQGLPEDFTFGEQREALTYKQLGNGVNVAVAYHVLREQVLRDRDVIAQNAAGLVAAVDAAPLNPDVALEKEEVLAELGRPGARTPVALAG
ncbi:DNA cytosine methyltransferase [Rhodococcus sp. X156]|uniref:DNA cytosine methyltransferase n=1 Tax=Rhodococcus sp. X156 TaxID=2499145 RepID=UPI000FDAFF2A|nr:DNA cytosine methyltransferase [Rhodococcus sp. X156]